MLTVAVPVWIEKLRGSSFEEREAWAKSDGWYLAEHGDDILFKAQDRTALAFNRLTRGIACAAYQPGGIRIFGLRFDAAPCDTVHDSEVVCDSCRSAQRGRSIVDGSMGE
jgi:hypothetical protein